MPHHVTDGYDNFCELITKLEKEKKEIYVFFSGSKEHDGKSWCPDCVLAEPVVYEVQKANPDVHFIYAAVGERATWKDPNNPFRKDPRMRLKSVPTLLVWGESKRLEDSDCADEELVTLIFEKD